MEKFINNKIQELNEINSSRENIILQCSYILSRGQHKGQSCGKEMRGFYFNNEIPVEDTESFIRLCNKMNLNRCPKHVRSNDENLSIIHAMEKEKNDLRILYSSQSSL